MRKLVCGGAGRRNAQKGNRKSRNMRGEGTVRYGGRLRSEDEGREAKR